MATRAGSRRRTVGVMLHHVAFRDSRDVYVKDVWGTFLEELASWLDVDLCLHAPVTTDSEHRFQHYPLSRATHARFAPGPSILGGALLRFASGLRRFDAAIIFLPTLQGLGAALLCRLARVPFIVYSGLGAGEWNQSGLATRIRARVYRALEARVLRQASGAIAAGAEVEEHLGRLIPTYRTAPITGIVSEGPRSEKRRIVLYVGALSERKGISDLLDAWVRIPDQTRDGWTLRFVGSGPLSTRVQEASRERGDCEMMGYVEHGPELFHLYEEAAILVLPSRNEGFPRVLAEAAAHGCALAATQVGGVAAAFSDRYAPAWFAAQDPDDLVRALADLMAGGWAERGEGARDWFRSTFAERNRALEASAFIATQVPELAA